MSAKTWPALVELSGRERATPRRGAGVVASMAWAVDGVGVMILWFDERAVKF